MANRGMPNMNRRRLLVRGSSLAALAVASPSLLAACSSGAPAAQTTVGGTLRMLTWQGYDLPDSAKPWSAQNHANVAATYVGSNDEIVAKVAAGSKSGNPTDLITYNQGYAAQFDSLGLLQSIDASKLSNYQQLFPFFKSDYKHFWVRPDGSVRGVPLIFNWDGITYDSSVVAVAPTSYDEMLDPKWKGKVAITDDVLSIYQIAAHVVGVDPTKMNASDFSKVEAWVSAVLAQSKGSSPTYGDMVTKLTSGDAVFAFPGWAAMNAFAATAGKKTIRTVLPREGGMSSCDAWAIPKSSTNAVTAYSFIDFSCQPATATATAISLVGGTPIQAAAAAIPADVKEGYTYDDIARLFDQAPMYDNPPLESTEYKTLKDVTDSWTRLKASA